MFGLIFKDAFNFSAIFGGFTGSCLMYGIKRGLYSNEAGMGSAPNAAATADVSHPAKQGLVQMLSVFLDTLLICTCTAMIMLLAPEELLSGLEGMELLQTAMHHHFGQVGVIFSAVTLWLFSFSTFIGVLFYARPNVAYLLGDHWWAQTAYKIFALAMLFIGGLAAYSFVWDLGDIGIALSTIFNMIAILPMSGQAIRALNDYTAMRKRERAAVKQKKE